MTGAGWFGGGRRRWWWAGGALVVVALIYLATAYGAAGQGSSAAVASANGRHRHHRRAAAPAAVTVTVSASTPGTAVPSSFLGLSTEYWALPEWSSQMPLLERVMRLLRVPGNGPMVLRIGGDSADHSFWDPHDEAMPDWAFAIAPRWLAQTSQLVRTLGLRVILDLNLITDSPVQAADWAQAAESALPHGSIADFEVGNEPDIYTRTAWLAITAGTAAPRRSFAAPLPAALTARDYVRDFNAYANSLRQVAANVPLAGPALARPHTHAAWVPALIAGARRSLGLVTIHRYPLSGCARPGHSSFATVARILSPETAESMAASLRPVIDDAHDAGLPIRLTELNSVNCGGRPGVSNTFATALWAPDALFQLLRVGIDGVNIHVRANTINAPFALSSAGLDARPLLYGLILFARALGPDARVVSPAVQARRSLNFEAYAVRTAGDALHVVLIDKGPRSVRVSLRLPATHPATVERLTAPSAGSESGVTLGGRWLGADGHWHGAAVHQTVTPRPVRDAARPSATYTVDVRHASAALVTVPVAASRPPKASPLIDARRPDAVGRALPVARFPRR